MEYDWGSDDILVHIFRATAIYETFQMHYYLHK